MIDPDLLDARPEAESKALKAAFVTLSSSGILNEQITRIFSRVASGSDTQPMEQLVEQIREYRWKAAGLRTLQQLGESFLEEYKS